ncbi:serine/threonine protein kinase [Stackebrandtia soli]|uniref:serine/threonine protein kinase n=1 Tax=Stackebrandtia soli TaxID=1892856 RepID=UPI0039E8B343
MRSGQVLRDRYRLVERIAAGGMGEVWRAEDLTLQRTVAIKVLHAAYADDQDFRRRFIREAQTLAALNAQGLVDVYDVCEEPGEDGHIRSYLVMELVEGHPVSQPIAEAGRLAASTTMAIIAQSAAAIAAAHRVGVIHRDIKPANILVDAGGAVTVIDFGIARAPGHTALTATGSVMGTVEYASPEQLRGEELTGLADVYALGVVAYECLSGRLPFPGDSAAAIIAGHLQHEPPPLPEDVPADVAAVVLRALSKDPAGRFASAEQFADACFGLVGTASPAATRRMLIGHASVSPPPTPETTPIEYVEEEPPRDPDVEQRLRKRTIMTIAATLGVVAVIAGAIGLLSIDWRGESKDLTDGGSESPSASPSPSPQPPSEPEPSTLVNAKTGECVAIETVWLFSTKVVMADCEAGLPFTFAPQAGEEDAFALGFTYDDDPGCLTWSYGETDVTTGDCDADTAWTFDWVETTDEVDVWQIRSVNNSNFCLAVNGEQVQAQNCTEGDGQLWHTVTAEKEDATE